MGNAFMEALVIFKIFWEIGKDIVSLIANAICVLVTLIVAAVKHLLSMQERDPGSDVDRSTSDSEVD